MTEDSLAKRLACLLQSYEMDEPHADYPGKPEADTGFYPDIKWAQIEEWLRMPHHGDCINQAQTCMRCVAGMVWHKAQWLAEKL